MSERFAWIYDPVAGVKRWVADMWSRRHILTLQTDVSNLQTAVGTIPTKTSDLANDSGFITASDVPDASSATPAMDGTGTAGSSADYARADHVHPSDTSKQDAGKFAVIQGRFASSSAFSEWYTLPSGFTFDNSLIVSLNVLSGGQWRLGDGTIDSGQRTFAVLGTDGIRAYNNSSSLYGARYCVILMRTDI